MRERKGFEREIGLLVSEERETPPRKCSSYDDCLDEALRKLKPKGFAAPPLGSFDDDYWEVKADVKAHPNGWGGKPYKMLVLLPSKRAKPSEAIRKIVDKSRQEWTMDCAYFVQIAHLYALSQVDHAKFDQKWANREFRLRYHESSGAGAGYIRYYFRRTDKGKPWMARYGKDWTWHPVSPKWNEATILAAMPRGSLVVWTNRHQPIGDPNRHENTVKVGDDRYRAFGLGYRGVLNGRQVELLMAVADGGLRGSARSEILADASRASPDLRTFTDTNVFLKGALSFRRP